MLCKTLCRVFLVVMGAGVLLAAAAPPVGGGEAGIGGVTRKRVVVTDNEYYYSVTDVDGSVSIETLTATQASERKKGLLESFRQANENMTDLKKRWFAAVAELKKGHKELADQPFPVSPPKSPKIDLRTRVPSNDTMREKAEERNNSQLELYAVCVVLDQKGTRTGDVIRQDKVYARIQAMEKEYAEAIVSLAEEQKASGDPKSAPSLPRRPLLQVVESGLSKDIADKLLDKVNLKLEKMVKPEAAQPDKPAANP